MELEHLNRQVLGLESCANQIQRLLDSLKGHIKQIKREMEVKPPSSSPEDRANKPAL